MYTQEEFDFLRYRMVKFFEGFYLDDWALWRVDDLSLFTGTIKIPEGLKEKYMQFLIEDLGCLDKYTGTGICGAFAVHELCNIIDRNGGDSSEIKNSLPNFNWLSHDQIYKVTNNKVEPYEIDLFNAMAKFIKRFDITKEMEEKMELM